MRNRISARLFGVALVSHVVGNWHQPDLPSLVGWIELSVGLLGIALIVMPTRLLFLAAAGATVLSVVGEMPRMGNHWLLAGLAGLLIVLTRGRGETLSSGLRWVLIVFYAFAAFAKLNDGFFDPSTSCAVFYANQSLESWSLSSLPADSVGARLSIWTTALIELSVVPLIVWRKTRWFGFALASIFHGLISLDLHQHFYDFTSVLFFFFWASLEPTDVEDEAPGGNRGKPALGAVVLIGLGLVLLSVLPPSETSIRVLSVVPFVLWIPFLTWWMKFLWEQRATREVSWRFGPAAGVVILLALLNGLSPYLELKTAYSFNMYSNLLTAQGVSNHLLVSRTFPIRDGYDGPVEIIESSDPGLEIYRDRGYLIAYPQFQQYLVGRQASVTYARSGVTTSVEDTSRVPGLATAGPWWWRYMPLRAIDTQSPPRCQDVFLPAL